MRARPLLLASIALLGITAASPAARADEKDACVANHSTGQVSRNENKLRAARAKFLACASDRCPPLVRKDCTQWYQELTSAQPTIVFEVHDASGAEVTDVRVHADGELVADRLLGAAHDVDPGAHVFRVELPSGDVIQDTLLVKVGEKNRHVVLRKGAVTPPPPPPPPIAPVTPRPEQPVASGGGIPPLAFVFGGITIASVAVFAVFSIAGSAKESDLRDTCAPFCARDEIDSAKRSYLIGDIALGVGVVAAAATVYVLLTSGGSRPASASARPLTWEWP